MIRVFIERFILLLLVIGISACSSQRSAIFLGDDRIDRIDEKQLSDQGIKSLVLDLVGSADTSDTKDTSFENYLSEVSREELGQDLRSFLISLEEDEEDYEDSGGLPREALKRRLGSVGGFYAILGLRAITECVIIRGNRLEPGDQRLFGKIVHYAFNEDAAKAHIDFEANHALTCDGEKILDETYLIHMSITPYDENGKENGMIEHKRRENGSFPGINGFLPNDPEVIANLKDMKYKLHAKGRSIDTIAAFKDKKILPIGHPIYERSESSCIDIFFENKPDPFQLPSQNEYCMGRCKGLGLINTGY